MQENHARPPARRAVIGLVLIAAIAIAMAAAGSDDSVPIRGFPAFAVVTALAFLMQWLAFIPAYLTQSERYYDLVGSLTYLTAVAVALTVGGGPRAVLLTTLVAVWAVRLGSFLFLRIRAAGTDRRFDRIKPFFLRFLMTWSLQGLWVVMTAGAALAAITALEPAPLRSYDAIGVTIWLVGFALEVIADGQKRRFRQSPENRGRFIQTGLWAISRHPNYFGEIVLWCGVAMVALPALSGWQHLTLVSPLFVYFLLTRVSGIPLLEAEAEKRWGQEPEYRAYVAATPILLPGFRRR